YALEYARNRTQPFFIANLRSYVTTKGNIELPRAIHTVQTIVARSIQVDHARSSLGGQAWFLTPNLIVVFLGVRHLAKRLDHGVDIGLNRAIGANQFFVLIRKHSALKASFSSQGKEHSTTSDKRLVVRRNFLGQTARDTAE